MFVVGGVRLRAKTTDRSGLANHGLYCSGPASSATYTLPVRVWNDSQAPLSVRHGTLNDCGTRTSIILQDLHSFPFDMSSLEGLQVLVRCWSWPRYVVCVACTPQTELNYANRISSAAW